MILRSKSFAGSVVLMHRVWALSQCGFDKGRNDVGCSMVGNGGECADDVENRSSGKQQQKTGSGSLHGVAWCEG
eukprot:606720-Rhodomonas_salina.2